MSIAFESQGGRPRNATESAGSATRESAFPITRRSKRGISLGPIYRELTRLDEQGLDAFEAVERFKRRRGAKWAEGVRGLLEKYGARPEAVSELDADELDFQLLRLMMAAGRPQRPTDKEKAAALLARADFLAYVRDTNAADACPPFPRGQLRAERKTEREKVAVILLTGALTRTRTEKELLALLTGFHARLASLEGTSLAEARRIAARELGGEPKLPAEVSSQVAKVIRRRRADERKEAAEWARYVRRLSEQRPDVRAVTIADWRRNRRRHHSAKAHPALDSLAELWR